MGKIAGFDDIKFKKTSIEFYNYLKDKDPKNLTFVQDMNSIKNSNDFFCITEKDLNIKHRTLYKGLFSDYDAGSSTTINKDNDDEEENDDEEKDDEEENDDEENDDKEEKNDDVEKKNNDENLLFGGSQSSNGDDMDLDDFATSITGLLTTVAEPLSVVSPILSSTLIETHNTTSYNDICTINDKYPYSLRKDNNELIFVDELGVDERNNVFKLYTQIKSKVKYIDFKRVQQSKQKKVLSLPSFINLLSLIESLLNKTTKQESRIKEYFDETLFKNTSLQLIFDIYQIKLVQKSKNYYNDGLKHTNIDKVEDQKIIKKKKMILILCKKLMVYPKIK